MMLLASPGFARNISLRVTRFQSKPPRWSLPLLWRALTMVDRYPHEPGAKGPDGTSQDAAEAIKRTVSRLRRLALHGLGRLGEATPLEAIAAIGLPRESIQPRFSELRAMGLVEPTGTRRRNPSGKFAAVLRLTDQGRAAL